MTALHRQIVEQQRELESDVAMAAGIQRGLLPPAPPAIAGAELAGVCLPAANVGGDYYDLLVDDRGRLVMLIADVAGHSIGSALLMAMARSILRREILRGEPPAAVLTAANEHDVRRPRQRRACSSRSSARVYDPADGRLVFANAGHNPPLLLAADGAPLELDADGAAIGILEEVEFEERSATVEPGGLLLLYTDGVVEALDAGRRAVRRGAADRASSASTPAPAPRAVTDGVVAALAGFRDGGHQRDDVTMVALRRQA